MGLQLLDLLTPICWYLAADVVTQLNSINLNMHSHTHTHTHTYILTRMHTHAYILTHTHTHTSHTHTLTRTHIHTHTHTHTHTHSHTHTYILTHTHTHTHTHTQPKNRKVKQPTSVQPEGAPQGCGGGLSLPRRQSAVCSSHHGNTHSGANHSLERDHQLRNSHEEHS